MTKLKDVTDGEKWLVANNSIEVVSLWYREPYFVGVLSDGSSVTVAERVPSAKGSYLEVSSKPEFVSEQEELFQEVITACLAHIRSAPDCEDFGDYVMEAIELSKRLAKANQS